MNNEFKFIIRRVVLIYYSFRYSAYYPVVMPTLFICAGVGIFMFVVLPQFQNWFSIRDEVEVTQARITTMKENQTMLQNLTKPVLDTQFEAATKALPHDKNFTGIVNTISKATVLSGVRIDDYQFTLGMIKERNSIKKANLESQPVQVELIVDGSVDNFNSFLAALEQSLPLSQVEAINYSQKKGRVVLVFFMKPLPKLNITYSDPIPGFTKKEKDILNSLYSWSAE
jgi:Tfp pilus assembly protein PilO